MEELALALGAIADARERARHLVELALACEELAPERGRAAAIYRLALEADPENVVALQQWRRLCVEQLQLEEAAGLLERELKLAELGSDRHRTLAVLVAELLLDLGLRQRAVAHVVAATALYPDEPALQEALATAGASADWPAEVARLADLARASSGPDAAHFCRRAARLLKLEAPEDTEYEWMLLQAFGHDPGDPTLGALLESFHLERGALSELLLAQGERVEASPDPDEQAARCLGYAFFWHERLSDPNRATAWLLQALAMGNVPFPIATAELAAELLGPRGEWDRLLYLLDGMLATPLADEARVYLLALSARVMWREGNDLERTRAYVDAMRPLAPGHPLVVAFDDAMSESAGPEALGEAQRTLVDAALALEEKSPDRAIEAFKKAIAVDPSRRTPHKLLARLCRRAKRWRALAEALNAQAERAALSPEDRLAVLSELVAVYRNQLRHDHLVEETLQRILALKPDSLTALDLLAKHQAHARRWPDLLATLGRMLPLVDGAERVQLHRQRAQIMRERLADEPAALSELEAALSVAPDDPALEDELLSGWERRREWEKVVAFRARQLERLRDPVEKLARTVELAQLAAEKLRKAPAVIEAWEAALAIAPYHPAALAALEQLYAREHRFQRLAEIYSRMAQAAEEPAKKAQVLQKLAVLCTEKLDDPAGAIDAWHAHLEVAGPSPRAEEALKRLYVRRRDWDQLEAFFAARGRLDEHVRVLERQLDEVEPAARVDLYARVAKLYEDALHKPDRARKAWEALLTLEPDHRVAAVSLIPYYEKAKDLPRLAAVLAVQVKHTTDADARHARLRTLANLHADGLADKPGALRWLLAAFDEDPRHRGVRGHLEEIAAEIRAWEPVVAAYQAALPRLEPEEGLALLRVMAAVQERELADEDGAIESHRRVLTLAPMDTGSLDALERLYLKRQAYEELQALYDRRIALLANAKDRRAIQLKLARLAEERGDVARAVAALEAVLEAAPEDRAALSALERLHRQSQAWCALAGVLMRRLALDEDDVDARFDLAEVQAQHLGELATAIDGYEQVLARAQGHAGARAALERHLDGAERHRVAAILDVVYQRAGEHEKLVAAREVLLEKADGPRRVELLHGIADILEQRLGRLEAAFAALGQALRADPSSQATLDRLDRLADTLGRWDDLVALYREVAGRPLSLELQVRLRCRLGAVYKDKLGLRERAIATFTRVLDLDARNAQAAAALRELSVV